MNKSVYKYAAEAGLPVGLYLTVMSACLLLSLHAPSLPVLIIPLAALFPFFLAYFMKRMSQREPQYMKFSALWLCGIYAVIFGTLICALFSGLYLTFVEPGFIGRYVENALDTMASSPQAPEYAATMDMMRKALDSRMLPSGMEFVSSMSWLTCFAGSIMSLMISLILTGMSRRKTVNMWR